MVSVVHFSTAHSIGDTRISQKELQTLANRGYDCHYVVFDDEGNGINEKITVHTLGERSRFARWRGMPKLYSTIANLDADIYHFHDIELIPIGIILKLRDQGLVIYDVHENYPHLINKRDWIPDTLRPVLNMTVPRLESTSCRYFDGVIAATEWVEESLRSRGVEEIITIHNFPTISRIPLASTPKYETDHEFMLVYTGGLSENRGIYEMIQVTAELRKRGWDVSLICLGKFGNDLVKRKTYSLMDDLGVAKYIDFPGYVNYQQMFEYLAGADIGLALLDTHHYIGGIPTKLFEYMYAELPVVITDIQASDRYVSEDWGRIVPEENTTAQADVVEYLLKNPETRSEMGRAGRTAVESRYSWEAEEYELLELYKSILDSN